MAGDETYTLGRWLVKAGQEAAFIEAWKELAAFFLSLPEPLGHGTLVQSSDNPSLFYSFGPWPNAEAVAIWYFKKEWREILRFERAMPCTTFGPI